MSNNHVNRTLILSQVFSGIGIGILLGLIMGLSVSPVVKTILGAMSGILAAFLGLQESFFSKQGEADQSKVYSRILTSSIRAGSFGFACIIGLLWGMYMRTHDTLTVSVKEQVEKWTDADYEDDLAREIVLFQKLKLFQKSGDLMMDSKIAEKAGATIDAGSGFLFSKEDMLIYCVSLNLEVKWGNNVENALEGYDGINDLVKTYATNLRKLPPNSQEIIMKKVKDLVCVLGNGTDKELDNFCDDMKKTINYANISESLEDLSSSDMFELAVLANTINTYVEQDKDRSDLMRSIMNVICE